LTPKCEDLIPLSKVSTNRGQSHTSALRFSLAMSPLQCSQEPADLYFARTLAINPPEEGGSERTDWSGKFLAED
jgi:hypothetical protein